MRVPYFPEAPSLAVINEIKYYMVLSVLKKMLADGVITSENYKGSTVAIAEKYRVSRLDDYIGFRSKSKRYRYCNDTELYTKELQVILNSELRNAIGHNDVMYDTVSQEIIFTPNPSDRTKQEKTYLLEFENETVHLFQAITVISEYLYRLREVEMIKNGHIPLPTM